MIKEFGVLGFGGALLVGWPSGFKRRDAASTFVGLGGMAQVWL